jgi:hypothetical protein
MNNTLLPVKTESPTFESISARLRAPFARADIKWEILSHSKDRTRVLLAPFIKGIAVVTRLNDVAGNHWTYSCETLMDGSTKCTMTICGLTKTTNAVFADTAFLKAAQAFKLGTRLERISGVWVDCDPSTLTPLESEPELPDWVFREFNPPPFGVPAKVEA